MPLRFVARYGEAPDMFDAFPSLDEEWVTFLHNSIAGLTKASELLRQNPEAYHGRSDWFRRRQAEIPRENSVTVALAELFNGLRKDQTLHGSASPDLDLRNIYAEPEVRRPRDRGISDEANPTDYRFTLLKDGELDLRIEAKTILEEADIGSEYLGARGLLRFEDTANPYTIAAYGGMVAYVVDHDGDHWRAVIASKIEANRRLDTLRTLAVGGNEHHVTAHVYGKDKDGVDQKVDVVHFVIEVEAVPSRRATQTVAAETPPPTEDVELAVSG